MRINIATGFFLPVPPVAGGATEKIWYRLAQEFATAGHEVTFISRSWPGFADRERVAGVKHIRLRGADHTGSLARNLWHDFRWGVRVARALPPADVSICNLVSLPVWLGQIYPRVGRVVAVVARMPKGQGRALGRADLLFSLSDAVTEKLCAENPALAGRIVPFPFPIDWQLHVEASAQAATSDRPLTIGYVGRIHPEKGVHLLLAAASRLAQRSDLPPWRLQLVGPWTVAQGGGGDGYRDSLLAEHGAALGNRLSFVGPEFDPARLAQRYGGIDVFCYPSLADKGETFGVAVAEAMAAGAAPVVSALACFRGLVVEGETGFVFDHHAPDAVDQLASRLAALLVDASQRRALSARAQSHARRYDFAPSAETVIRDLNRLIAGGFGSK